MQHKKKKRDPSAPLKPHTDIRKKKWRSPGPCAYKVDRSREYLEQKKEFKIGVRPLFKKNETKKKTRKKKKKKKKKKTRSVTLTREVNISGGNLLRNGTTDKSFRFARSERFPNSLKIDLLGPGSYCPESKTSFGCHGKAHTFRKGRTNNINRNRLLVNNFNNQTQHGRRSTSTLAKNDDKSVSGTDSSAVSSALAKKRSVFNMRSTIGGRFNLAPTNRLLLDANNSREDKKISLKQMAAYRKEAAKILLGNPDTAKLPDRPQTTNSYISSRATSFKEWETHNNVGNKRYIERSKSFSQDDSEQKRNEILKAVYDAKHQQFLERTKDMVMSKNIKSVGKSFGRSKRFVDPQNSAVLQLYPKHTSDTIVRVYSFGTAPRSPPLLRQKKLETPFSSPLDSLSKGRKNQRRPMTSPGPAFVSAFGQQTLSTLPSCPSVIFPIHNAREDRPSTADIPGPGSYRIPSTNKVNKSPSFHKNSSGSLTNAHRGERPRTADIPGPGHYNLVDEITSIRNKKGVVGFGKGSKDPSYIHYDVSIPAAKYNVAVSSLGRQFKSEKTSFQTFSFSKAKREPDYAKESIEPKYSIYSTFDKQIESHITRPKVLKFGTSMRMPEP
eukprot:g1498.t1